MGGSHSNGPHSYSIPSIVTEGTLTGSTQQGRMPPFVPPSIPRPPCVPSPLPSSPACPAPLPVPLRPGLLSSGKVRGMTRTVSRGHVELAATNLSLEPLTRSIINPTVPEGATPSFTTFFT